MNLRFIKTTCLVISFLLSFCYCSRKGQKKTHAESLGLVGKVKFVEGSTFKPVFSEELNKIIDGPLLFKFAFQYDQQGNILEEKHYNSYGHLLAKYIYQYDKQGNILGKSYYSEGRLLAKYIYECNRWGNAIESKGYNYQGRSISKQTFEYDEYGNRIEQKQYNADGSILSRQVYKYDERGNLVELEEYNLEGDLVSKTVYEHQFDSQGSWIGRTAVRVEDEVEVPVSITMRKIEYYKSSTTI